MDTKFEEGDVAIHFGQTLWKSIIKLPEKRHLGFTTIFNTLPNHLKKIPCFQSVEATGHLNESGNQFVAQAIFSKIKTSLKHYKIVKPFFERIERQVKISEGLNEYLLQLSKERVNYKNIGAIVMNCNPFTKGHMYLIEQALKQVDFLYVFVVEEDLSEFSFKDRFNMVQKNCERFTNVKVLPSGRYMISTFTFADYFNKDDLQDKNIMPAKDVNLFGQSIAPCLNIKIRFVGEEPLDNVTRQYNEAMKQILGECGVKVIEMPRLKLPSGEFVNATKVRHLLHEGNIQATAPYLTEETYRYIIDSNKYNQKLNM